MSNHCAITENQSMQYETEYSKMGCVWYQPYANFERIGLANGPKVDVQSYGSLIGGDTKYKQLKNGKFILQPSLLVAYTFVKTFDYTNASGVKISSDPLNSIQFHPNIKFMGNVGKGWQPYACIGMVWNILNETKVTANDIRLPEMSIKPYVEYGIGLQKCWNSETTGFIQTMIRNGGRNGVALMFGFKWTLGHKRIQNI